MGVEIKKIIKATWDWVGRPLGNPVVSGLSENPAHGEIMNMHSVNAKLTTISFVREAAAAAVLISDALFLDHVSPVFKQALALISLGYLIYSQWDLRQIRNGKRQANLALYAHLDKTQDRWRAELDRMKNSNFDNE